MRGKGGVWYGDKGVGSRADQMLGKEIRTVHEDDECDTMSQLRENRVLMVPTQTASVGHAAK